MAKRVKKRDKWHFLDAGARWDHSTVPIYEASARGKCVPLLKTLLSSHCTNDCGYCAFRAGRRCSRDSWNEEKLARMTMHLWKEGKVRGLFLSSSVFRDPDYVTEKQLNVLRTLRNLGYTGYIHLRLMPGVGRHYIREAVELSDRVGVNLEAPNEEVFMDLCPSKGGYKEAVLKRLEWTADEVKQAKNSQVGTGFGFGRSGIDTQMIVGAAGDNDWQHLKTTTWLYKSLGLKRVYYSGFEPIEQTPFQNRTPCPPHREYRLYQCAFLIRDYGFNLEDFSQIVSDKGFLPNVDPKVVFARQNIDLFPADLNEASYHEIMRIPSIGPLTAKKIIEARRNFKIQYFSDLEEIIGPNLTRTVAPYIDLKDKRLTYFSKLDNLLAL